MGNDGAGKEQSRWIHPVSGQRVEVVMENRTAPIGIERNDYTGHGARYRNDIQWIGRIPVNSPKLPEKYWNTLTMTTLRLFVL